MWVRQSRKRNHGFRALALFMHRDCMQDRHVRHAGILPQNGDAFDGLGAEPAELAQLTSLALG